MRHRAAINTLVLILCFVCTAQAQQSKPKLRITTALVGSDYCTGSNLRLNLQLTFQNTGTVPVLLRKDGFFVGRYLISRDLGAQRKGKRLVDARQEVSGLWLKQSMLQDRSVDESSFVRLAPGATQIVPMQIQVTLSDVLNNSNSFGPRNYLLELFVSTWLDTKSTAERLQNDHRAEGYLWTKSLMSAPMPFTVTEQRVIKDCN